LVFSYIIYTYTNTAELKMSRVATRVIEIDPGEWVVQFSGGLNSWTTFSDTFITEADALAFEAEQIASADFGDKE
jgi:hypothetical protein